MNPVFYIQDTHTRQWLTSIVPLKDGSRAVYFGPTPSGARWMTRKGAEAALEKLRKCGTNPRIVADRLTIIMIT